MKPRKPITSTRLTNWGPWTRIPNDRAGGIPEGGADLLVSWHVNRVYSVRIFRGGAHFPTYDGTPARMMEGLSISIMRRDGQPAHSWRDFQFIKDELVGPDRVAVEMYPRRADIVDPSNIYYLWVLPVGFDLPFNLAHPSDEMAQEAAHVKRKHPERIL